MIEFSYAFDTPTEKQGKELDRRFFELTHSDLTTDNYTIGYSLGATELICKILARYRDYFVIFIGEPHPNPNKAVPQFGMEFAKFKNVEAIKGYQLPKGVKNVLIYFTSTCYQTGEIHNVDAVISFIDNLKKDGISVVAVNDAVQQLFFIPSKYTTFDYIIYTAHSIIGGFNMGICIYRKVCQPIGERWYSDVKNHIDALEKLLPLNGLDNFQNKYFKAFENEIRAKRLIPLKNSAKHFFVAQIVQNPNIIERLFDNHFLERYDNKYYIKMRLQQDSIENFTSAVNYIKNLLRYDYIDS